MTKQSGAIALVLPAVFAFGCGRSTELVEADHVRSAISRLRDAPASDEAARRKLVVDLAAMPAGLDQARRARDACAAAYSLLLDGEMLAARAKAAAAPSSSASAAQALTDLRDARTKLDEASAALDRCGAASTALTQALGR